MAMLPVAAGAHLHSLTKAVHARVSRLSSKLNFAIPVGLLAQAPPTRDCPDMHTFLALLRSLLLTALLSFIAPALTLAGVGGLLWLADRLAIAQEAVQAGLAQLQFFLAIFGGGRPWQGVLAIAGACALVSVLFDTVTFYRAQRLSGQSGSHKTVSPRS